MHSEQNMQPDADPPAGLALYYYPACPYCIMVLRAVEQMGLKIDLRNIQSNSSWYRELVDDGGRSTVPCLRIEEKNSWVEWLYESYDIIDYLQEEFS